MAGSASPALFLSLAARLSCTLQTGGVECGAPPTHHQWADFVNDSPTLEETRWKWEKSRKRRLRVTSRSILHDWTDSNTSRHDYPVPRYPSVSVQAPPATNREYAGGCAVRYLARY